MARNTRNRILEQAETRILRQSRRPPGSASNSEVLDARAEYLTLTSRLDELAKAEGVNRFNSTASTTLTVYGTLALEGRGRYAIVSPYTTICEIRHIDNASAALDNKTDITINAALENSHSDGALVLITEELRVPAEMFITYPDGGSDSGAGINRALEQMGKGGQADSGGQVYLAPGMTYNLTTSVHPPTMSSGTAIGVVLEGNGATLKWNGSFTDDAKILDWDKDTYNNGSGFNGHRVRNLRIDGNDVALWGIYSNGFREECVIENVRIFKCVGSIYADDCWYSQWRNVRVTGQTDGVPGGSTDSGDVARWEGVHNSHISGPVFFRDANSTVIDGLKISAAGVDAANIPAGSQKTYHAFYFEGIGCTISGLNFESTNGHGDTPDTGQGDGVDRLISFGGSAIEFGDIYIESVHCDHIAYTRNSYDPGGGIFINSLYITGSEIRDNWFLLDNGTHLSVGAIHTQVNNLLGEYALFCATSSDAYVKLGWADIKNGEDDGSNIDNLTTTLGPWVADSSVEMERPFLVPKLINDFDVVSSDPSTGYITVTAGTIQTDKGQIRTSVLSGTEHGWKLRTDANTNYFVVINQWGVLYLRTATAREGWEEGETYIARVTTDGSNLPTVTHTWSQGGSNSDAWYVADMDGFYINNYSNRAFYDDSAPTYGRWDAGDIIYNNSLAEGGIWAWVCTVAGSPGTWESIGRVGDHRVKNLMDGVGGYASATTGAGSPHPGGVVLVTSTDTSGSGSLYDAIDNASSGDYILIAPELAGKRLSLDADLELDTVDNVTIDGQLAPGFEIETGSYVVRTTYCTNIIIGHLSFRADDDDGTADALTIRDEADQIVITHCQFYGVHEDTEDSSNNTLDQDGLLDIIWSRTASQCRVTVHRSVFLRGDKTCLIGVADGTNENTAADPYRVTFEYCVWDDVNRRPPLIHHGICHIHHNVYLSYGEGDGGGEGATTGADGELTFNYNYAVPRWIGEPQSDGTTGTDALQTVVRSTGTGAHTASNNVLKDSLDGIHSATASADTGTVTAPSYTYDTQAMTTELARRICAMAGPAIKEPSYNRDQLGNLIHRDGWYAGPMSSFYQMHIGNSGSTTTTTDGSGDITITHGIGATPTVITAIAGGTTAYHVQPHTVGSSTFDLRVFDTSGAAVTSTSVTVYWWGRR